MTEETALTQVNASATETLEQLVTAGDLSGLSPQQRVQYYMMRCQAAGLDPRTKPFDYLELWDKKKGAYKLVLYATKGATEQLAERRKISTEIRDRQFLGPVYVVTCRAVLPDGQHTDASGVVPAEGLDANDLANALMRAETKAKRRAVLAVCGMGMTDETEIETIPDAVRANVDYESGEIKGEPTGATRSGANGSGGPGATASPADAPETATGAQKQPVLCPECGEKLRLIPAGVSKKTGKDYSEFVGHPEGSTCKVARKGKMHPDTFRKYEIGQEADEWEPPGEPGPKLADVENYAASGAKLFAQAKRLKGEVWTVEVLRSLAVQFGLPANNIYALFTPAEMTQERFKIVSKAFAEATEDVHV